METHCGSLGLRLCDDTASFQVEVSDAARHGEPPVNVSLTHTVPRHVTTKPLDPEHKYTPRTESVCAQKGGHQLALAVCNFLRLLVSTNSFYYLVSQRGVTHWCAQNNFSTFTSAPHKMYSKYLQ